MLFLRRTPTTARLLFVRQLSKKGQTYPTNHQIPFDVVRVQESDGTLHPSSSLSHLLASINKSTHLVRLVSRKPPVVRVLTHLEDTMDKLERKAELKARKNKSQVSTKQLRLSWLTGGADYEHKMAMARKELEKGDIRMDFLFSPKRGASAPSRFEMLEHMQKVADAFKDVSNEWKEKDFSGRGNAKLFLQSVVRAPKVLPSKSELEKLAKKALEKREKSLKHTRKDDSEEEDDDDDDRIP
jgi:translation initiation factor IF-3